MNKEIKTNILQKLSDPSLKDELKDNYVFVQKIDNNFKIDIVNEPWGHWGWPTVGSPYSIEGYEKLIAYHELHDELTEIIMGT